MAIELTAALVALAGVLASALVSFVVSAKQARIESQKLLTELQAALGSRLYERRLEVYPSLYAYLSRLSKVLEVRSPTRADLLKCFVGVEEWDSNHAVLFGAVTGRAAYHFRQDLRELTLFPEDELLCKFSSPEQRNPLREKIEAFELALKYELGTYHFESPTTLRTVSPFPSYRESQKSLPREGPFGKASRRTSKPTDR